MAVVKIQFSLRIDPVIYAKLKVIAKKDTRSVSNLIDYLIIQKIMSYERENGEIELTDEDIYDI
ncbi:MAG: hypothetical protein Q4D26_10280 [Clostridia bacterium]|nr:hypothetical protein [Clostridia bacterium]